MLNFLREYDLEQLPLRAIIVLALRCTQRVQPLMKPESSVSAVEGERSIANVHNIALLIAQTYCREGLNQSSRLSEISEENRWKMSEDTHVQSDPVISSGEAVFEATSKAAFSFMPVPGVATTATAECVIRQAMKAINSAMEALGTTHPAIGTSFVESTWRDYTALISLGIGTYPEIGDFIDPSEEGQIGSLWVSQQPDWYTNQASQIENSELLNKADAASLPLLTPSVADSSNHTLSICSLYKYVTANTLCRILDSKKVRCAPISSFNDPFDGQLLTTYKFSQKELNEALVHLCTQILSSEIPEAIFDKWEKPIIWGESILKALKRYKQGGGAILPAEKFINKLLADTKFQYDLGPTEAQRIIISNLADKVKVFCLSEVRDNLLMWAHYSDNHKGAVIGFRTNTNYTLFVDAKPVKYSHEIPTGMSPQELAHRMLGDFNNLQIDIDKQFLTKSEDWGYEREWRIVMKHNDVDENCLANISPNDVEAIYLGCRMSQEDQRRIVDLVVSDYKHVKFYLAEKDEWEFRLNFLPINLPHSVSSLPAQRLLLHLEGLYQNCLNMYFRKWNDSHNPTPQKLFKYETIKLDVALGVLASRDIQVAFRNMLDVIDSTVAETPPISKFTQLDKEQLEQRKLKTLKPSAVAYGELEELMRDHIDKLKQECEC